MTEPTVSSHDDPVQRFVADLNQLRISADMHSYRVLAAQTHYSLTAVWRANRGTRLPSRHLTLALVKACGGDINEWETKWRLARELTLGAQAAGSDDGAEATLLPGPLRHRSAHVWIWLAATVATALVLLAGLTVATAAPTSPSTPMVPRRQFGALAGAPADGDDPYLNKCGIDQQRLDYQNLYWPNHKLYGWIELYHSHICGASWGYIFGPNSPRWRITIVARRLPDNVIAPSSTKANTPPNSWGNVLLTTQTTCVRIEGYISVGIDVGPTAVTSCQPDRKAGGIGPPPTPPPPAPREYAAVSGSPT